MTAKRNDSATCFAATRSAPYRLLDRKPNIMMHMNIFRTSVETPLDTVWLIVKMIAQEKLGTPRKKRINPK
jgi:hypothetical protein